VPLVQPTLAAISSGLIPCSISVGIFLSTAAVIFFGFGMMTTVAELTAVGRAGFRSILIFTINGQAQRLRILGNDNVLYFYMR
jgi:hypothetical protein